MKKTKTFYKKYIAPNLTIRISNDDCPGVEEALEAVIVFPDTTIDDVLQLYSGLPSAKFKKAMNWLRQNKVVRRGKLNVKIYDPCFLPQYK
jgi:hypothetical protein